MTIKVESLWSDFAPQAKSVGLSLSAQQLTEAKTRSNFVLQNQTAVELGGNAQNSALIFSSLPLSLESGVYRLGSDIDQIKDHCNLGLMINVTGKNFTEELLYIVLQSIRKELLVKGIMVKGDGTTLWIRISQSAVKAQISLAYIGSVLHQRLADEYSEIEKLQILFLTTDQTGFERLRSYAQQWSAEQEAIKARIWESRGFNFKDCHVLGHCGKCSDKKLCANVRKMERIIVTHRKDLQGENS